jgi:hypothetical protein
MRYSNHCKIIDPKSEYYGQVFEVYSIRFYSALTIKVILSRDNYGKIKEVATFDFSQIQFCVTKDGEPVKIGEEYVCIGDFVYGSAIHNFVDTEDQCIVFTFPKEEAFGGREGYLISGVREFKPLHPTNKIKITAEKIEEIKMDNNKSTGELLDVMWEQVNVLTKAVNRLSK